MSQKTDKKTEPLLSPRPGEKQADNASPVQEDLDEEQERLRAAGVAAFKRPSTGSDG